MSHAESDVDLSAAWSIDNTRARLTQQERTQVRAWRTLASHYQHGDCGRDSHRLYPGCDIVCVSSHAKCDPELVQLTKRPPWEKQYRRPTQDEDNAVTDLMCKLVMHAVPKPPG